MILRILLPFFIVLSLSAQEDSWSPNTELKFEAGIFLPNLSGSISNIKSDADFEDDLGASKSSASYFSLEYPWIFQKYMVFHVTPSLFRVQLNE